MSDVSPLEVRRTVVLTVLTVFAGAVDAVSFLTMGKVFCALATGNVLFLAFVWIALVYIIVAFTDITATAFIGEQALENGETVSGGGIATSSLLYLVLPVIMDLLLRYTKLSLNWAKVSC